MTTLIIIFIIFWTIQGLESGSYIQFANTHEKKYQKLFHFFGALNACILSAGFFLALFFNPIEIGNWFNLALMVSTVLSLRWVFYDSGINYMLKKRFYYTGTTSWLDKQFGIYTAFFVKMVVAVILVCAVTYFL